MAISVLTTNSGEILGGVSSGVIITDAANHVAGNLLALWIRGSSAGTVILSISDIAGNTYLPLTAYTSAGVGLGQWWYAANCLGNAANQVQVVLDAGYNFISAIVLQIAGVDLVSPEDTGADVGGNSVSTGTPTSPSFSTVTANEIILFGGNVAATSETWTAGLIGAGTATMYATPSQIASAEYLIVSSIQSNITASASVTPAAGVIASVAAFKSSGTPPLIAIPDSQSIIIRQQDYIY